MNQQLANQLIEHYEKAVKVIKRKRSLQKAHEYCDEMHIDFGICRCARNVFDVNVGMENVFIKTNIQHGYYFCKFPLECETIPDITEALQTRIDILKTFKES